MNKEEEREERLMNIRMNVDLLEMFGEICKDSGSDISKILRAFMVDCVSAGEIIKRPNKDVKTGDFRDTLNGNIHNNHPPLW